MSEPRAGWCNACLCLIWIVMPVGALTTALALEHPWGQISVPVWIMAAYFAGEAVLGWRRT
jgi:hypothetical protein